MNVNRVFWPVVACVVASVGVLEVRSALGETQTWDEGIHISAGYTYLARGDYSWNVEHPPLVKLVSALPLFVFNEGAPRFTVLPTDYGLLIGAQRPESETTDYWRVTQYLLPSYTMIPAVPEKFIDFTGAVPIDDEHMMGFTVGWRPDRPLANRPAWYQALEMLHSLHRRDD